VADSPAPVPRRPPLVALAMTAVLAVAGTAQLAGQLGVPLPATAQRLFADGSVGYDELLMDGGWLRPWASQLVHGGPVHLLPNLAVVAVMSWRLERGLGPAALLVVATASVAAGTLGIACFEDLPAIGASVLAFGLWGGVLAMAFRSEEDIGVQGRSARHGLATLPLLALLFAASLLSPGTTLVGHVCGLLGGTAATVLVPAEAGLGGAKRARALVGNLAVALILALAPGVLGATAGRLPALAGWPRVAQPVDGTDAALALPVRMLRHPTTVAELPAWRTTNNSAAVLYAGISGEASPEPPLQEESTGILVPDEPAGRWPGWRDRAWRVVDPNSGQTIDRFEEHLRSTPSGTLRVGWRLGTATSRNRVALFESVLAPLHADAAAGGADPR